jgi:hypothetical protein
MPGHILWELFYWPGGIVLGNLLASLIWSSIFEWRLRVHHRKIHASIHHKGDHNA